MHVDGFRFDLASMLSRDESGRPLAPPPLLWDIDTDPACAGTKRMVAAWDAAGLYQVGACSGDRWQEWHGPLRADVRRLLQGDPGTVTRVASRWLGSPDLYGHQEREPEPRLHFVTGHDGFTLSCVEGPWRRASSQRWGAGVGYRTSPRWEQAQEHTPA